jgi:hypothetical protein
MSAEAVPVSPYAQQQWYRFERRVTEKSAGVIPFELFYVIPEGQARMFSRVYDVFLGFKMVEGFQLEFLKSRINEYHCTGMARDQASVTKFERWTEDDGNQLLKALSKTALDNIGSSQALVCVPVLPRRNGDRVSPGYMLNKNVARKLTDRHRNREGTEFTHSKNDLDLLLDSLSLYVRGDKQLPCAVCLQGVRKVVNDKHCSLGTLSCLDKIKLVGTDAFQDKAARSITPLEYDQMGKDNPRGGEHGTGV